ncbi:potassium transporter TrkA [Actinomycetes bacterium]|jgi:trk system potassium uptake protein TrkA|nr:potassium transporter TrkA [Actinomycetes bacterium]
MKVIIAGGGSVGRFTAREMVAAGHSVIIIDNDRATIREYQSRPESNGIEWHFGDACDYLVLDAVGVRDADVVASVTGDDEDNLVISLLSKQEFGVPRVVARANNPKNYWMFNEMWGVDVSVSTPHLITSLVQEATSVGNFVRLMQLKGGKAELVEVTLAESSPAVNRAISELVLPRSATIVAVVRAERVMVPTMDTVLRAGDEVMALITEDAEGAVTKLLVG